MFFIPQRPTRGISGHLTQQQITSAETTEPPSADAEVDWRTLQVQHCRGGLSRAVQRGGITPKAYIFRHINDIPCAFPDYWMQWAPLTDQFSTGYNKHLSTDAYLQVNTLVSAKWISLEVDLNTENQLRLPTTYMTGPTELPTLYTAKEW